MLCTNIVLNVKTKTKKQFLYTTCCELVLFLEINEQSLVILWVNWFKNESFWHRFTCNLCISPFNKIWKFPLNLIIFKQNFFWFCTPKIDTPQPTSCYYGATSYLIASATSLPVYHFTLLIHDRSFGCLPEIESLSQKLLKFIPTTIFIIWLLYARHYNPRLLYFSPHFSVRFMIKSG